jgi:hypothetical protein
MRALIRAREAFESDDSGLFSAVARRCLGKVQGGEEGEANVREAEKWMASQGVVRPDRMSAMLFPVMDR